LDLPHSMLARCSPELVIRIAALGSSFTISTSLRAGRVVEPSWSTEAGIVVLTEMSRSVPDSLSPSFEASTRILASTGRVVFDGTLAATAWSPSCSFSRVIVNFIRALPAEPIRKNYQ
jgi:hypothetical protein